MLAYKSVVLLTLVELAKLTVNCLDVDMGLQMMTKIARRMKKLEVLSDDAPEEEIYQQMRKDILSVFEKGASIVTKIRLKLDSQWEEIQKTDRESKDNEAIYKYLAELTPQEVKTQTRLKLPEIENFIQTIKTTLHTKQGQMGRPLNTVTLDQKITRNPNNTLKIVATGLTSEMNFLDFATVQALFDNELWAKTHCQNVAEHISSSMNETFACFKAYFKVASKMYEGNPEMYSVMLLTCYSFLVILDKKAVHIHPMILDHGLDMDVSIMDHLLLPFQEQLDQLRQLESYLASRFKSQSPVELMGDPTDPNSLDVRYAYSNEDMEKERLRILEMVEAAKQSKKQEVQEKYAHYLELKEQAERKTCDCNQVKKNNEEDSEEGSEEDSDSCKKCALLKEASDISVSVYRVPFPSKVEGQRAIVFDFNCPNEVRVLRSAVQFFKTEVLKFWIVDKAHGKRDVWSELRDLQTFKNPNYPVSLSDQITLMSSGEFSFNPHPMHPKSSPLGEKFIIESTNDLLLGCVCTELSSSHDINNITPTSGKNTFTDYRKNQSFLKDLRKKCTMVANGIYKCLQWTIDGNLHSDNEVICRQSECPAELSLKEFRVFGCCRAGSRLQIRNLIAALKSNALSWHREDVVSLVCQILWETGGHILDDEKKFGNMNESKNELNNPRDCSEDDQEKRTRNQHRDLLDEEFVFDALKVLEVQLDAIQDNWDKSLSLLCLAIFGCRLVEFSENKSGICSFLFRCRRIGLAWSSKVKEKIESLKVAGRDECELQLKLVQISLIVVSTFNVSADNVEAILNCSDHALGWITAQNNVSDNFTMNNTTAMKWPFIRNLVQKSWSAGLRVEKTLKSLLENDSETIQGFVSRQYEHMNLRTQSCFETSWVSVPHADPWMKKDLNHGDNLCLNILTGAFLMNSDPVRRLPANITSHSCYQRIFGCANLTVGPGALPGSFVTINKINKASYEFLMVDSKTLLVTKENCSKRLFYLPESLLQHHLPYELRQFGHWLEYNEENQEIESKSVQFWSRNIFENKLCAYQIVNKTHSWELINTDDKSLLISMGSQIFLKLQSLVFDRVEKPDHVHVFLRPEKNTLSISLPRHRISFSISENYSQINAFQYPGFKLAKSGYLGTLIGFASGIVLESGTDKKVIIPHGEITESLSSNHVQIEVNKNSFRDPSFFAYSVDENFKQLSPPSSDVANLYLAMFHVKTSYPLPDPFTKLTGFEMGMQILNKGRSYSCTPLGTRSEQILTILETCCCTRDFFTNKKHGPYAEIEQYPQIPPYSLCTLETLRKQCVNLRVHSNKLLYMYDDQVKSNQIQPTFQGNCQNSPVLEKRAIQNIQDKVYPLNLKNSLVDVPDSSRCLHNTKIILEDKTVIAKVRTIASILRTRNPEPLYDYRYSLRKWATSLKSIDCLKTEQYLMNNRSLSVWEELEVKKECLLDLYELARQGDQTRYLLFIMASFLTYKKMIDIEYLVPFFLISEHFEKFQALDPPDYSHYHDLPRYRIKRSEVETIVNNCFTNKGAFINKWLSEKCSRRDRKSKNRRYHTEKQEARDYFDETKTEEENQVTQLAMNAWPGDKCHFSGNYELLKKQSAIEKLSELFYKLYKNKKLLEFLKKVDTTLDSIVNNSLNKTSSVEIPEFRASFVQKVKFAKRINLDQKFDLDYVPNSFDELVSPFVQRNHNTAVDANFENEVENSVDLLIRGIEASDAISQHFKNRLEESWKVFKDGKMNSEQTVPGTLDEGTLERKLKDARKRVLGTEKALMKILIPKESQWVKSALHRCGLMFRESPLELVPLLLRRKGNLQLPNEYDWRDLLGALVVRWTEKQRIQRCLQHLKSRNRVHLQREWNNVGHTNWVPQEFAEWLILEAEGNFMIRPAQVEIAQQMLDPPHNKNAVMQLNMGEGKSSVIVPILVASIYLKKGCCPQVVVLGSLHPTNSQSLRAKMGGVLDMRLLKLPFCRDLELSCEQMNNLSSYLSEHKKQRGFLVSTPEQMMSMQLKALEIFINGSSDQANSYHFFSKTHENIVRNILDESDDILSVKRQLVYTMGSQIVLDGNNQRWIVVQSIFRRLKKHANLIFEKCGSEHVMIELDERNTQHQFNVFRLLDKDSKSFWKISDMLIDDFLECKTEADLKPLTEDQKICVRKYIMAEELEFNQTENLQVTLGDSEIPLVVFLLRGFFGLKILQHCLTLRHRVNYGVGKYRKMAVPFRAKDVAADKTDFGHPDVALALTQLTYYYQGIPRDGFEEVLRKLTSMEMSVAIAIYDKWVNFCHPDYIPRELRNCSCINLSDQIQLRDLYKLFHKHVLVVDYWLVNMVYLHEAKQFPQKLSATGWDLCRENGNLVTGFSGTNEAQLLLPLTVHQRDLPSLQGTDALVIHNMLKRENQLYHALSHGASGKDILDSILEQSDYKIKVILDPGALILLHNKAFVELWMSKVSEVEIEAAIYFDEEDNMMVLDRNSFSTPFHLSPFLEKLDSCIVYLDDVHTRGTDLQFPNGTKAAVTLGKGLAKDKLSQACMRMRLLGCGHSLSFFASYEVDLEIQSQSRDFSSDTSEVVKVISWALKNSQKQVQDGLIHWANQGSDQLQKLCAYDRHNKCAVSTQSLKSFAENVVQNEVTELKKQYGIYRGKTTLWKMVSDRNEEGDVSDYCKQFRVNLVDKCKELASEREVFVDLFDEEQERELEHEEQEQRQVVRPALVCRNRWTNSRETLSGL
ncbi:uncharacterized protein LOC134845172 isoform X2 [Symsagittifera roscoffensis]|uniref:uncharacterized protein LOC134845172 isoform X2 n=1 Tax=Symsagittifera roscoffensis TaxID=84072 RepID=UPI00307C67A1